MRYKHTCKVQCPITGLLPSQDTSLSGPSVISSPTTGLRRRLGRLFRQTRVRCPRNRHNRRPRLHACRRALGRRTIGRIQLVHRPRTPRRQIYRLLFQTFLASPVQEAEIAAAVVLAEHDVGHVEEVRGISGHGGAPSTQVPAFGRDGFPACRAVAGRVAGRVWGWWRRLTFSAGCGRSHGCSEGKGVVWSRVGQLGDRMDFEAAIELPDDLWTTVSVVSTVRGADRAYSWSFVPACRWDMRTHGSRYHERHGHEFEEMHRASRLNNSGLQHMLSRKRRVVVEGVRVRASCMTSAK